jgi:hypothetical protein
MVIRDMEIMLRIVWGEDKTEEWMGAIINDLLRTSLSRTAEAGELKGGFW